MLFRVTLLSMRCITYAVQSDPTVNAFHNVCCSVWPYCQCVAQHTMFRVTLLSMRCIIYAVQCDPTANGLHNMWCSEWPYCQCAAYHMLLSVTLLSMRCITYAVSKASFNNWVCKCCWRTLKLAEAGKYKFCIYLFIYVLEDYCM
jgi:hypothetical protein